MKVKNTKGFTLVELIAVIAIMAVLAGIVGGTTISYLNKSKDEVSKMEAKQIARNINCTVIDCIANKNFDNLNTTYIVKTLKENYPEVTSFTEIGKADEKKYLIQEETIKGDQCFTVSFIMVERKNRIGMVVSDKMDKTNMFYK